ncbi:hypothetical protein HWV62_34071 [Athelia sp. TMB]|nr:hypothetical protein HWV62_34071 [Athelia sp. TMB]
MDETAHASNKRKRVDKFPMVAQTRSDIWFDDGNIVVQAEGTQFKVHRSMLAMWSPVFKETFSKNQTYSGDAVEGCPVVRVTDSAVDMNILLGALFQRRHVEAVQPLSIDIISAFIRLGKKWQVDTIFKEGLKRLLYEYPSTLDDFDALVHYSQVTDSNWVEIDVARLAREQNLLSILPVALYGCIFTIQDAKELAKGVVRGDGSVAQLAPDDLISCLVAYQSLATLQAETTLAWMNAAPEKYNDCKNKDRKLCAAVRTQLRSTISFPSVNVRGLDSWSIFAQSQSVDGMCTACVEVASEMHGSGRVDFWDGLPGIFGLPSWEELRKKQD